MCGIIDDGREDAFTERLELVTTRLEELFLEETDVFFKDCIRLSKGERAVDCRYLDYAYCRESLGRNVGVYYCMLFSQLSQLEVFIKNSQRELVCIYRELLAEIIFMAERGCEASELRDTLYWFCVDYAHVFARYQLDALENASSLSFGGMMLLGPVQVVSSCEFFREHIWDCGLCMGERFKNAYVREAAELAGSKPIGVKRLTELLLQADRSVDRGFILTKHQWEVFDRMLEQIKKLR